MSYESKLNQLRTNIRELDSKIVNLLKERLELAVEIGKIKSELKLPVKNFQVEKEVIQRARLLSEQSGLDPDFMENIMSLTINASVNKQLQEVKSTPVLLEDSQRVLVVGGLGKMGDWLLGFFQSSGYIVHVADIKVREEDDTHFKTLPNDQNYDYIFIATPLDRLGEDLKNAARSFPDSIIIEIGSLKSHLIDAIAEVIKSGGKVVSIHPMFGADVVNLSGRKLIICTNGLPEEERMTEALFSDTTVEISHLRLNEHDKYILYTLGLSHLINLLMGDVLQSSEYDFPSLRRVAGTTFDKQMLTTLEVFSENPYLYYSIQHLNKFRRNLFFEMQDSLNRLMFAIEGDEPSEFIELMEQGRMFLLGEN